MCADLKLFSIVANYQSPSTINQIKTPSPPRASHSHQNHANCYDSRERPAAVPLSKPNLKNLPHRKTLQTTCNQQQQPTENNKGMMAGQVNSF
jgi:hypothetical protein